MAVSKAKPVVKKTAAVPKISLEKKPAVKKPAPSKTVAAKPTASKTVAAKPAAAKPKIAKSPTAKGNGKSHITPEQRYRMICDAAYFLAERRGFVGGNPSDDWVAAEAEVDELLRSMQL
jgi:hypothetical protein